MTSDVLKVHGKMSSSGGGKYAALHLACMRLIAAIVPQHLAATAQAMYAFGAVAITALLTLASGRLYATLGAEGFLVMALLCAAAAPLTLGLRGIDVKPAALRRCS